jgi:hypothetical protein
MGSVMIMQLPPRAALRAAGASAGRATVLVCAVAGAAGGFLPNATVWVPDSRSPAGCCLDAPPSRHHRGRIVDCSRPMAGRGARIDDTEPVAVSR